MSTDRRQIAQSRRRRVIYQTSLEDGPETAAERRAAERLREARRPTAHYGSHVRRRLRGRWFSLVPVSRMALSGYALAILGFTALLCLMHYLSVRWEPLALREELARPFRLDRPDSFGTYAHAIFLLGAAGTSLLVYQLRRYKIDDYKGHYRLWRPVIVLLALMSLNSVCGLVPWAGTVIDTVIGKRVAMAGADWLRIVMAVGGTVLAVRLLAEVHRSRLSLAMMVVAVACWFAPLLGYWNLFEVNTFSGWMTNTTTPLIAAAAFWVAAGAYLRMLFRDVRGLDSITEEAVALPATRSKRQSDEADNAEEADERRGWLSMFRRDKSAIEKPSDAPEKPRRQRAVTRQSESEAEDDAPESRVADRTTPAAASKRRWLGLRRAATTLDGDKSRSAKSPRSGAEPASDDAVPKKRWFGRSAKPVNQESNEAAGVAKGETTKAATAKAATAQADKSDQPKRSWFGLKRPAKANADEATQKPVSKPAPPVAKSTATEPAAAKKGGLGGWLSRSKPASSTEATSTAANRGPVDSSARPMSQPSRRFSQVESSCLERCG